MSAGVFVLRFSSDRQKNEWPHLHPKVREIVMRIAQIHDLLGWDTEVTSCVRRSGEIPGDSGVHVTGRAADCVARLRPNSCSEPVAQVAPVIQKLMNYVYPRQDQFASVLWHSFGYGFHYHVQVPWSADYKDLNGSVPEHTA